VSRVLRQGSGRLLIDNCKLGMCKTLHTKVVDALQNVFTSCAFFESQSCVAFRSKPESLLLEPRTELFRCMTPQEIIESKAAKQQEQQQQHEVENVLPVVVIPPPPAPVNDSFSPSVSRLRRRSQSFCVEAATAASSAASEEEMEKEDGNDNDDDSPFVIDH
jgi:hypothetical protein